tara:strand:+ start:10600 stop:10731 length:132 start_codon:yes stop_codon:yes gene_type:complete
MLELKNISKKVGNALHISDVSMSLEKGSVNVSDISSIGADLRV